MPSQFTSAGELAVPLAFAGAGLAAGIAARRVLRARLARATGAARRRLDTVVLSTLTGPVVVLGAVLGLYLAVVAVELPSAAARLVEQTLLALVIASVSWTLARLAAVVVRGVARSGGVLPAATLLTNLARFAVLVTGGLILLPTLGLSITPIITALGVGGLAVALALQDTLANLFAGIHILVTRQIRPGDFVRLESGEEGYVQDITWRNTSIRQLPNNLTIVPNAKLAGAVITNYSMPDPELAVLVEVAVAYDSDLAQVERVTVDVARAVLREVPGGVPEFEPFIRFNAFGESGIRGTVILRGREVVDQHLLRHEFIKRLHARYRAEGIEIPLPQRTVHVRAMERAF